jgi:hypothetical protein
LVRVDGDFGVDQVVGYYGYGGRGRGEQEACLGADEVAGKGGTGYTFLQDHTVMDGGDGDGGGANVDDEGCVLA